LRLNTKVGIIEIRDPLRISERAKFWAGALAELARMEEVYAVVQTMLEESYEAGRASTLEAIVKGWATKLSPAVVDAEFRVIEDEAREAVAGSSEELLHEGKLEGAESVGQSLHEAAEGRVVLDQADGATGAETRPAGSCACGSQHYVAVAVGKTGIAIRQTNACGSLPGGAEKVSNSL